MINNFTDENFASAVLEASKNKLVLVDFSAAWCGPCRMQAPILDELDKELGDKVIIGKLDIDNASKTAEDYDVMSVPTIMLFKNEEIVHSATGVQPKSILLNIIEKFS